MTWITCLRLQLRQECGHRLQGRDTNIMAVYAIGDIQGCYDRLRQLLDEVSFDPARDVLWCVGDLVNRGPDSLSVLRYLRSLGDACIAVLGNHDLHLLCRSLDDPAGKQDSLTMLLQANDAHELIDWLRHRPLLHHDPVLNWCMVHAGLPPTWTLAKAKKRAAKVEEELRSDCWQGFARQLSAAKMINQEPTEKGLLRKVFTVHALTRMRYCSPIGVFDFANTSGGPGKGQRAWFEHPQLGWRSDCRVVYGHWAARGLVADQPHVLGLDSGCVWGNQLSLAWLDTVTPRVLSLPCPPCQEVRKK